MNMIRQITDLTEVEFILKKYFPKYKLGDPFEQVLVYGHDEIIGVISYSVIYERGEINYLLTLPPFRGKGIGTELLKLAIGNMKQIGCQNVSLEVAESNKSAINLYMKQGFVKVGKRKNYYGKTDAYLMVLELR